MLGLSGKKLNPMQGEHPKLTKIYSPNASVKDNFCSLKFNKVKSKVILLKS